MTVAPVLSAWIIAALLAVVLVVFVALEWRRPIRFRLLRILSCILVVVSLCFILFRPLTEVNSEDQIVLLTRGYDVNIADSLRRTLHHPAFYQLDGDAFPHAIAIPSYRSLLRGPDRYTENIQQHHADDTDAKFQYGRNNSGAGKFIGLPMAILGDGLPGYALDSIHTGFKYYPSHTREGITSIHPFLRNIGLNKKSLLTGTYYSDQVPATIYLSDAAGKSDSVKISQKRGSFEFWISPRISGRTAYRLQLKHESGTAFDEEVVPLYVDRFQSLKILFLQGYPSSEMQYLKNYLADRGHGIASRTKLSKNAFRTEFVNIKNIPLGTLTSAALEDFDLVIVDHALIAHLPASARRELEQSVRRGLGLLVAFSGAPDNFPYQQLLPVKFNKANTDSISLRLRQKRYPMSYAGLAPAVFKGDTVTENNGKILSGIVDVSAGRSSFQLLQQTYTLLLAGDSIAYGSIWAPLIERTARRSSSASTLNIRSEFPLTVNEPVQIEIISETTPALYADSVQIPVREDLFIRDLWHATVWVGERGWHNLINAGDTTSFYAFDSTAWRALRVEQKHRLNQIAGNAAFSTATEARRLAPVPLLPFWVLLVLSLGFLWLAPRL